MSSPAVGCRLNCADGEWCPPDAQQPVAPLPVAVTQNASEVSARHEDYYYTAADTGERRSCTGETERGEKSAD